MTLQIPHNLVEINQDNFDVEFDLRYATKNNVCKIKMYREARCFLHLDAANALQKAIEIAAKQNLRFKIFDGFRPIKVQQFMFDQFPSNDAEGGFVSNPQTGSVPHCRGVAIDLTLIDKNKKELNLGSDFDDFSELAFHNCNKISDEAAKNRKILLEIMSKSGWDFYSKEWWHYQLFDARKYKIIDFQSFESKNLN